MHLEMCTSSVHKHGRWLGILMKYNCFAALHYQSNSRILLEWLQGVIAMAAAPHPDPPANPEQSFYKEKAVYQGAFKSIAEQWSTCSVAGSAAFGTDPPFCKYAPSLRRAV